MKKFNWKVILLVSFTSFVLIFGGLFFYAYKKISPAEIKRLTTEQLQKAFPKAQVEIGEIQLTPSFSFKLKVAHLKMTTQKSEKTIPLFRAEELRVKIPLWALISGVGKIELQVDKPETNYLEFAPGSEYANNWTYAMDTKVSTGHQATTELPKKEAVEKAPTTISVPSFLSNIKADLRFYDINVDYALKDGSKGKLVLSRFLVKGINLKGQTAFELDSKFKFNMKKEQFVNVDALVVGQVNLSEFIESQKLNVAMMIQLTNFTTSFLKHPLPDIKTDVKISLDKSGKIGGDFLTSFMNRNKVSGNFSLEAGKTKLENFNLSLYLKDLVEIADQKPLLGDINDVAFNLTGNVDLASDLKTGQSHITPSFKFSLSPELEIPSMAGKAKVKFDGAYQTETVKMNVVTQVLDGVIECFFKGEFDPNTKDFDLKKMKPFNLEVKMSHLNVTKELIQKILYSKKVKESTPDEKTAAPQELAKENASEKAPASPLVLPPGTITVSFDKIQIGKNNLDGKSLVLVSNDKITTKNMNFSFSEGKGELTHVTQIEPKTMVHKFDFKLIGLNMAGLHPFLPPQFEQIKGSFTGLVRGSVETPTKGTLKYDVSVDVNAKKGELKGLNIGDYANGVIEKLPEMLKSKLAGKKLNIDGNFETLLLKGNFSSSQYQIEKMKFVGIDNKADIEGNGVVFPPPSEKQGSVELSVLDNTGMLSNQLENYAGTRILPLRLVGPGFVLKPDYQYTIEKLLKGTLKKQTTKQVESLKTKAKDLLQQKIKDQMGGQGGNVQDNVKGMFKGLFKKK